MKKKTVIISSAAAVAGIALIHIFWVSALKMSAFHMAENMCAQEGWWRDYITYSMLSSDIKAVVSEEDFSGESDALLKMYRSLENVEFSDKDKSRFAGSTSHWRGSPVPHIITDDDGRKYIVWYDIDFDVNPWAIIPQIKVVNFTCHIEEYEDSDSVREETADDEIDMDKPNGGASVTVVFDENMLIENGTPAEWLKQCGEPIYYANGTIFAVALPDNAESVRVTDTVIRDDGNPKYDLKAAAREPDFDIFDGAVHIRLEGHTAAFLSSNLADYDAGACLRSFDIEFVSEETERKYTFCIRSDASFEEYYPPAEPIACETVEVDGDTYIADCTADEWIKQKGEPPYYPDGTIFKVIPPNDGEVLKISCTESRVVDLTDYDFSSSKPISIDFEVSDGAAVFTVEPNYVSSDFCIWRCFDVTVDFGGDTQVYTFCVSSFGYD